MRAIETNCWHNRGRQYSYTLLLSDGTRLGILESQDFFAAYPALSAALGPYDYGFAYLGRPDCLDTVSRRLHFVLTNRPGPPH